MRAKNKSLFLNFIASAVFFLIFRFGLDFFVNWEEFNLAFLSGVLALVFSPKFMTTPDAKSPKVLMKWIFMKGHKEI